MTKTTLRTACFIAIAAASATASAAQPLLAPRSGDLVAAGVRATPAPATIGERAPVAFAWALDPQQALVSPTPATVHSREYWRTVDASELARGVDLPVSSEGAVLRVSPARGAVALRADDLGVSAGGRALGFARGADATALRAAGMDATAGTQVVQLAGVRGAASVRLRAANARGDYVVHVFEPASDTVLDARADALQVQPGQPLRVAISATQAGSPVGSIAQALLVAPDGSSHPAQVRRSGSGWEAIAVPSAKATGRQGLWELQVFANVGALPRDARVAFAVGSLGARLHGTVAPDARLHVAVPVEVAAAGRYEARGTLHATAPDGSLRPVSQAHAAAWFAPGAGRLVLPFDRAHLPAGYGAPFELRDLELNDQSRMQPVETRARAARF